mmetsp:Transcript_15756/g.39284  ORF Transcript_15756/g.39284 Transcript_15756/m.39284 type:complete len:266 (-) Transcript_15756:176-973(-)
MSSKNAASRAACAARSRCRMDACVSRTARARCSPSSMPDARRSRSAAVGRMPVASNSSRMACHTSPCLNLTYFSTSASRAVSGGARYAKEPKPSRRKQPYSLDSSGSPADAPSMAATAPPRLSAAAPLALPERPPLVASSSPPYKMVSCGTHCVRFPVPDSGWVMLVSRPSTVMPRAASSSAHSVSSRCAAVCLSRAERHSWKKGCARGFCSRSHSTDSTTARWPRLPPSSSSSSPSSPSSTRKRAAFLRSGTTHAHSASSMATV